MDNNKYFLYARKSTEGDERQVQSLDDQVRIMRKKAKDNNQIIVWEFIESKSAKDPWREHFNTMIEKIEKGEANWILAWKLDRLSRNPIDSGKLQYMLQSWFLSKVVTNEKEYTSYDSGLLMSVESGMANQYILDLKKAVRRWLDSKYAKWIRPSSVPIGYLNDIMNKTITLDNERYQIVRKMWELMLTWNYSIRKTLRIANNEYGLRTVKKRKSGWWELTRSSWERIFRNIFYTGYFEYNGELKQWIHTPIISMAEYHRVQSLLWREWAPKAKNREFPYTGMITCWCCWCAITAETKNKYIKSTGITNEYTYYHCTKRGKNIACDQKTTRVEVLEAQIRDILESIEIGTDFQKWIYATIRENFNSEFETRIKIFETLNSSIISEEKKLWNLTNMLLEELINKDEFTSKKRELQDKIENLKSRRDKIDLK